MSKFKVGDKVRIKFDKSFPLMWVCNDPEDDGYAVGIYLDRNGTVRAYSACAGEFELVEEPKEVPQQVPQFVPNWRDNPFGNGQRAQRPYESPGLPSYYGGPYYTPSTTPYYGDPPYTVTCGQAKHQDLQTWEYNPLEGEHSK